MFLFWANLPGAAVDLLPAKRSTGKQADSLQMTTKLGWLESMLLLSKGERQLSREGTAA